MAIQATAYIRYTYYTLNIRYEWMYTHRNTMACVYDTYLLAILHVILNIRYASYIYMYNRNALMYNKDVHPNIDV